MRIGVLGIGAFLGSWIPAAQAVGQPPPLFVNGDFEAGTFDGWTLEFGKYWEDTNGNIHLDWGKRDHGLYRIIGPGEFLCNQTLQVDPYQGSRMARINGDVGCPGNYNATRLSQTATVQEGQEKCGQLEISWGAMLVDPGHDANEQPHFIIEITHNTETVGYFEASASDHNNGGWVLGGDDGDFYDPSPIYYRHGVYTINLEDLKVDDKVKVQMTVTDCALGGHDGWAFLDGIMNKLPSQKQPVNNPPIGKMTKQIWGIGGSSYDTVILSNGEYYLTETDLKIPGRGFDFEFTRTYRSRMGAVPTSCDNNPPENVLTPLGYGWDFNYNMRLAYNNQDGSYTYYDGAGRKDVYNGPDNPGGPPPGYYDQFIEDNPGQSVRIIKKDGTTFLYELQGDGMLRLKSITDRNTNRMAFDYDGDGRLTTVHDTLDTNEHNRDIRFAYNGDGTLHAVTDFAGRSLSYAYDHDPAHMHLVRATSPAVAYPENEFPNGKSSSYEYDTSGDPDLGHNLLRITDGKGQVFLENTYIASGEFKDALETQTYGFGTFRYAYSRQSEDRLLTTETDRNGNVTEWQLNTNYNDPSDNDRGHVVTKTEYVELVPGGGVTPLVTETHYNKWGEKSKEILPRSNVVDYQYDEANANPRAMGNLLRVRRLTDAGDPDPLVTQYSYEPLFNQVETTTDPRGKTTRNFFDNKGNVVRIASPPVTLPDNSIQNAVRMFEYNGYGQVTREIDPEGNATKHTYYESGPMTGYLHEIIGDPEGLSCTRSFEYDAVGNVVREFDGHGRETTFAVNELNQVQNRIEREATLFNGVKVRYETATFYDANSNVLETRVSNISDEGDMLGDIRSTYEYDKLNHVVAETKDAGGLSLLTQYTYEANENRKSIIFPKGNEARFEYDQRDMQITERRGFGSPDEAVTRTRYDENGNRLMVTTGEGRTTEYVFDRHDRLTATEAADGSQTLQSYDKNGNITEVRRVDADGTLLARTTNHYDELNRLDTVSADHFDENGTPIRDGVARRISYFDRNGRLVRSVDDNGRSAYSAYDRVNRLTLTTDALGNTVESTYDCNDNLVRLVETEQGPGGPFVFTTTHTYDELNRLVSTSDNLGHTQQRTYDSRGNRIKTIDALGNRTISAYDAVNRLISVDDELRLGGTGEGALDTSNPRNPDGLATSRIEYDRNGNVVARVQDDNGVCDEGGCRIVFAYDDLDRIIREEYPARPPDHGPTMRVFAYDHDGNVVQVIDQNGSTIDNAYDKMNRLARVDVGRADGVRGTTLQTFAYDGLSRMIASFDNNDPEDAGDNHTTQWAYDSLSNVRVETHDGRFAVRAENDGAGFRSVLEYPGGRRLHFGPDALNRIAEMCEAADDCPESASLCRFEYVGPARLASRTMGNGTLMRFSYDQDRRVANILHQREGGSRIARFDYEYDAMHNRTLKAEHRQEMTLPRVSRYTYDSAYRLLAESFNTSKRGKPEHRGEGGHIPPGGATGSGPFDPPPADGEKPRSYVYDGVGNRTTSRLGDDPTVYVANPMNEYSTVDAVAQRHDANGNLIDDGTRQFAYDFRNRMVLAAMPEGTHRYEYDATGRRVAKTIDVGGADEKYTRYILDAAETIEERDKANDLIASYVYSNRIDDVLSMTPGQPCSAAPFGLVGWWPAEESADDIWGWNNGRLRRNTGFSDGRVGKAFHFDEDGEGVVIPGDRDFQFTDAISVEFWLWIDGVQDGVDENGLFQVLDKGHYINGDNTPGGWMSEGYLLGNGKAYLMFGVPGLSAGAETYNVTVDSWHHIAGVYEGAAISIYVDGELAGRSSVTGGMVPNDAPITIGYYYARNSRWFRGAVDELAIYERSLQAEAVRAIFQARGTGKCPPMCTPPPQGVVSWWPGESDAKDVERANDGVLRGSVSFEDGVVGKAFHFDGQGEYVQVASPAGLPLGNAPRTIELWFRTPVDLNSSTESALVQYGTGTPSRMFGLITSQNAPGKLYFFGQDNDLGGTTSLLPNTWYHAAVTYDGAAVKLYVNGRLDASRTVGSLNTVLNSNGLTIGWRPPPGEAWWTGEIDEVTIYSRALSSDEVKAIYIAGADGKCVPGGGTQSDLSANLYFHADALGTITHVTDADGNLVEAYRYDAFGNLTITDPAGEPIPNSVLGNAITYTGRWRDAESSLYFYRARYYDPATGRFLTRDPNGFVDGMNLYAYVGNTPANLTDPLGEEEEQGWLDWAKDISGVGMVEQGFYDVSDALTAIFFRLDYGFNMPTEIGKMVYRGKNAQNAMRNLDQGQTPGHITTMKAIKELPNLLGGFGKKFKEGTEAYRMAKQVAKLAKGASVTAELMDSADVVATALEAVSKEVAGQTFFSEKAFDAVIDSVFQRMQGSRGPYGPKLSKNLKDVLRQAAKQTYKHLIKGSIEKAKILGEKRTVENPGSGASMPPRMPDAFRDTGGPGGDPKTDPPIKQKMEQKSRPYKVGEGTGE